MNSFHFREYLNLDFLLSMATRFERGLTRLFPIKDEHTGDRAPEDDMIEYWWLLF